MRVIVSPTHGADPVGPALSDHPPLRAEMHDWVPAYLKIPSFVHDSNKDSARSGLTFLAQLFALMMASSRRGYAFISHDKALAGAA
jgi:hypothetical protein